jgi:hypothetical protein
LPLARPIGEYESVRAWRSGLAEQWGGDPLADDPSKLDALGAFCELFEKDPDELVSFCFLRRRGTGERFASVKRREEIAARLRELRDRSEVSGVAGRKLVSDVLSFLIHNGVMMSAGSV